MHKGSVFKSNRSQAVRIPKDIAWDDDVKQVDISVIGRARVIAPAGELWDSWFDGPGVTDDFMPERDQPEDQIREDF
tara:strand:- start:452 stop:682 length:231 start_codon:yes stop_codon:yes gene_type:complete